MYLTTKFLKLPKDCKVVQTEILENGLVKLLIVSNEVIDDTSKERVEDAHHWEIIGENTTINILD